MKKIQLFNIALKTYGITKKDFATFAQIPYDTVAGWERAQNVPLYAFTLYKKMVFDKGLKPIPQTQNHQTIQNDNAVADRLKLVATAFWGKDIRPEEAVALAKKGNKECLTTILKNVYYKDAVMILGPKTIQRHAPHLWKILGEQKAQFLYDVCARIARGGR